MTDIWLSYLMTSLLIIGKILLVTLPLIGAVAYLTLMERKVIAAIQLRKGPNVVGAFGLLQPYSVTSCTSLWTRPPLAGG